MAHIAIVTGLLIGRIYSTFELASRLGAEGHRVTFICQPSTESKIASYGFECKPVPEISFDYKDPRRRGMESTWIAKFLYHFKYLGSHYREGKKILKLEKHKSVLKEVNPDMILVDVEIHDLIFTAIALHIPIKLYTDFFSDKISMDLPPIRSSITPGKGVRGSKVGIIWAWLFLRTKIYGRVMLNTLRFKHYRRYVIKKYAQEIGFKTNGLLVNTLPPLYSFTKLPTITMAMPELEFPHKPAKNLIYIGAMVYENRIGSECDPMISQRLVKIFNAKKDSGKHLIYCSVGSLAKGDVSFLQKVIAVAGAEKKWLLIMSLGRNLSQDLFPDVPNNVHLFDWVPQPKVLAHADCCINHAGINSINECLHYAVPMVIYSLKYTDENGNAARMAYHGLGIAADKDKDGVAEIDKNIRAVLQDSKYRETILKFNGIYKGYRQQNLTHFIFHQ